jgi:hypothetical protein
MQPVRTGSVWLLLGLLLACPAARAQEVVLSCDTEMLWGYITERSFIATNGTVVLEGPSRTMEAVNTSQLTLSTEQDARGESLRIGSRRTSRSCGPFTIVLSSGWFNANPMGEMGADDFSVFELRLGGKRVLGPLALGSCGSGGRSWGECPADWVTSTTFQWGERLGQPVFRLNHAYEEQRAAP